MKETLKAVLSNFGKAVISLLTLILIVVGGWAFFSLAAALVLLLAPILLVLFTYWVGTAKKITEKGESVIESFEDFIDNFAEKLKEE